MIMYFVGVVSIMRLRFIVWDYYIKGQFVTKLLTLKNCLQQRAVAMMLRKFP